jgi:hypothetical protein
MPPGPQRASLIDEFFELGRRQPVPSWRSQREPVGPFKIVERGLLHHTQGRLIVLVPGILAADDLFRGKLGNPA